MLVCELKCQMCNARFECEILDDDDPNEQYPGQRVCCPKCRSPEVEKVRVLKRKPR